MTPLLDIQQRFDDADPNRYLRATFEVPSGVERLVVTLQYDRPDREGRIYPIIEAPDGFRGFSMERSGLDARSVEIVIGVEGATPGSIPGTITPGTWRATLDPVAFSSAPTVRLRVQAVLGAAIAPAAGASLLAGHVARPEPGWYRGELHAHTIHSDGDDTTEELVGAASERGLDFLALTDHFTISGFEELAALQATVPHLALMRGMELTSHRGHANLHGLEHWVDVMIDAPERPLADVIDDVHAQGGLFCVNHPFSNSLAWQRHDTPWARVDLLEVYHHLEYHNNILQLAFWDRLLDAGFAIVGVAGTDTHHATVGRHALGQCFTDVHADELSERGVLAGLRRGRVVATLGPRVDVAGRSGASEAGMFESLPLGGAVSLHVTGRALDRPATVFVLKNGLYHGHAHVGPGAHELTFHDVPDAPSYYRVEWHARTHPSGSDARAARAWDTVLAVANPVFVGATFQDGRWK